MAENIEKSEVMHLTELDFDVSKASQSLLSMENSLRETVNRIQNDPNYKLTFDIQTGGSLDETKADIESVQKVYREGVKDLSSQGFVGDMSQSRKELESTRDYVRQLVEQYGDLAKVQAKTDAQGNITSAQVTYDDSYGQKIIANYELQERKVGDLVDGVQQYEKIWVNTSNTIVDDLNKQSTLYEKQIKQIDELILKQKAQITAFKASPESNATNDLIKDAETNLKNLYESQEKLSKQGIISSDQSAQISQYGSKIKELDKTMKTVTASNNNFLTTITDKARWLAAFYLIDGLKNAFFETIDVVRETEVAVVELQRVLNEDVSAVGIQDELYGIAQEYGRMFDEVSDSAVKFAQTGATWNETLALTEATMLAVNTAELEVETATTGLIAVISQFGYEAEDMLSVIDKINITADSFAVTSEKIVAALQRTGSAAVNANLGLEDTISLITTMSEATGRSGETIGTALNSLLVYSQRASSLEIFSGLSDEMARTVELFESGKASIIDVWTQLSKDLEDDEKAIELSSALSTDSMYEQMASSLEMEASELTDQIKDVYATAGTHRQNYFIALLDNMETYTDAMSTMGDAEGYSLAENEKTMDTLTRQYQTLVESVRELAVEFGEAGFLDFLKLMVKLGIGATDLVDSLGGIRTVLVSVSGIIISLKLSAISGTIKGIVTSLGLAKTALIQTGSNAKLAFDSIRNGALKSGEAMMNASTSDIASYTSALKSLAVLGIGAVVTAISFWLQKQEESRQATLQATQDMASQISEMTKLKDKYAEVYDMTGDEVARNEELESIKEDLVTTYGMEKDSLDDVNTERQKYLDLMNEEISSNLDEFYTENKDELNKARESIEQGIGPIQIGFEEITRESITDLVNQFDGLDLGGIYTDRGASFTNLIVEGKDLYEVYENLEEAVISLQKRESDLTPSQVGFLSVLEQQLDIVSGKIEKYGDQYSGYIDLWKSNLGIYSDTTMEVDSLEEANQWLSESMTKIANDSRLTESEVRILEQAIQDTYDKIEVVKQQTGETPLFSFDAEASAEKISQLSSSIDQAQSSFSDMYLIMDSYNRGNALTIDQVQTLMSMSGQYASMLSFEGGQLQMLDSATGQVVNSKQQLLAMYISEQAAAQIATLAESLLEEQTYATAIASGDAANMSRVLSGEMSNMAYSAITGAQSINTLTNELRNYQGAQALKGDYMDRFVTGSSQILSNAKDMYSQIGSIANSPQTWGSDGIDQLNKAAQDAAKSANDARIKELEAQKEAVEERYNAEIDKLKEVQEQNDRITEQEEYLKNLRDKQMDLDSARARSGIEYRQQEAEALEEIAELEKEWEETQRDWSIEDTIAQLEAMRDAEVEVLDAQINSLRDATSAMSSSVVGSTGSALSSMAGSYSTTLMETSKETQEETEDTVTTIAQSVFDIYVQEFFGPLATEFYDLYFDSVMPATFAFNATYDAFYKSFIQRAQSDMNGLFSGISGMYGGIPKQLSANPLDRYGSSSIYNNNNSRSGNFYLNISGNESASKVTKSISDYMGN